MVSRFKKKFFAFVASLVMGSSFNTSGFLGFHPEDEGYMGISIRDKQSKLLSLGDAFLSKVANPENELNMFVTKEEDQCYAKRANVLFSTILGMKPDFPESTKKFEADIHKLFGYTGDCVGYMAVIMKLVNGTYGQQLTFLNKLIDKRENCPFCKMFAYSLRNLLVLTYSNKYKDNSWDTKDIIDDLNIMIKNDNDLMNCTLSIYGRDAVQNKIAEVFTKDLIENDEKVKKEKKELNLKAKTKKRKKNKQNNSNNIEEDKKEENLNKEEDKKESLDEILSKPQNYIKPEDGGWYRIIGEKLVYVGDAEDRREYEGVKVKNIISTTAGQLKTLNIVSEEDETTINEQLSDKMSKYRIEKMSNNVTHLNKSFLFWAGDQLSGVDDCKESVYTVLYGNENADLNHTIGGFKNSHTRASEGGVYNVVYLSGAKRLVIYVDAKSKRVAGYVTMEHYNPNRFWYKVFDKTYS